MVSRLALYTHQLFCSPKSAIVRMADVLSDAQRRDEQSDWGRGSDQESHQCIQQEDLGKARIEGDQITTALPG